MPIRKDIERSLTQAKTGLDQATIDKARSEGQTATIEQAGTWALEGLGQLPAE